MVEFAVDRPVRSPRACSGWHVVIGMAWVVMYAVYLIFRIRSEALPFLREITDLHPVSDMIWCMRKGMWLVLGERLMRRLGLDPELPPQGFYNAGQKLVAVIAVLCSLGLALTGLILVFVSGRPGTEELLRICLLVHFCCAGLMAIFLPVHIYMAAFAPARLRPCGPCSPVLCLWNMYDITIRCGSAS